MLEIHRSEAGEGNVVVSPTGDLDAFGVASFRRALAQLGERRVIIDLEEVVFVDSAGLGALIGCIRRAREQGGRVVVACSRPGLVRVLRSTGFDRIAVVTSSLREAVAALDGPVASAV